jgi:hypothetical protein
VFQNLRDIELQCVLRDVELIDTVKCPPLDAYFNVVIEVLMEICSLLQCADFVGERWPILCGRRDAE